MPSGPPCQHLSLVADGLSAGSEGYTQPEWSRRVAAAAPSGRVPKDAPKQEPKTHALAFPAPLALPEDELSLDPTYPPQTLRSWSVLKNRNKLTQQRKTIYVARSPTVSDDVLFMATWATPTLPASTEAKKKAAVQAKLQTPLLEDVVDYLRAFYHGLDVKIHGSDLCFQSWDTHSSKAKKKKKTSGPLAIALRQTTSSSCTRIRIRLSPDGLFPYQLNLNDLLDVTIEILPDDAYALLLLVDQDLFEDDEDDFCCGRAYGGSRVAVVSSARYNPVLHAVYGIDRQHMWPASHCLMYLNQLRQDPENDANVAVANQRCALTSSIRAISSGDNDLPNPIRAAVAAFQAAGTLSEPEALHGLWLFCVARTASHELGHCFGMDHCVYYACVMQGTASIAEDCRQPPYLCPVCATKRARAVREVSSPQEFDDRQYSRAANEELARWCEKWNHVGVWAGFEAWLRTGFP